jgi:Tfp pilus assembly protein PilW
MRIWRDVRGFTLAELLTAFAVLALVLAGVLMVQRASFTTFLIGTKTSGMQQNARVALERMARELRESTGALTAAGASSMTLTVPTDAGHPNFPNPVAVTYRLNGTNLERNEAGAAVAVFIAGVQTLTFTYFDGGNTALAAPVAAPVDVRRVDIRIRTRAEDPNVKAGAAEDTGAVVSTTVRLRNVT